ncbi:uncharacterized protein LOC114432048 [Parambassis ranga]|uniref:Uncharacterized protein LOC114432048 n=1 Tax=Parambassis ranga TaxID=210632 RepID=A0A6P7HU59_9TELE|nr:uncharacterized protein LOC114432048 [Parambassis ranga]
MSDGSDADVVGFFPPQVVLQSRPVASRVTAPLSSVAPENGNTVPPADPPTPADPPIPALPSLPPTRTPRARLTASPVTKFPSSGDALRGQAAAAPTNAPVKPRNPAGNPLQNVGLKRVVCFTALSLQTVAMETCFCTRKWSICGFSVFHPSFPPHTAFDQSQDRSSLLRSALANERARANGWGPGGHRHLLPLQPYSPAGGSLRPSPRNPLFPFSNGFRQPHSSSRSSDSSPTSGVLGGNPPCTSSSLCPPALCLNFCI